MAANFCGRCGQRLRPAEAGSGSSADRVRDDVRVLDSRAERRQITVMFCDLVGSVSLSEELDPEDLTEVIVAYRNAVHSIIDDLGGYIARYLGDGLLIYFGYPQAHEDDAVRAVRAALRIIQDVNSLAARRRLPVKSPLQAHIGVHTGLVVVGELGTGTARERDGIIGETPNVAARLEKLAEPDTVLISAATYELVARHFHCTQLAAQPVKGISKVVDIYYVRAEIEHFGEIRPRVREAIRIVDRKQELRLLRAGWGQAKRGRGGVFVLSGEPGVGKRCSSTIFDISPSLWRAPACRKRRFPRLPSFCRSNCPTACNPRCCLPRGCDKGPWNGWASGCPGKRMISPCSSSWRISIGPTHRRSNGSTRSRALCRRRRS